MVLFVFVLHLFLLLPSAYFLVFILLFLPLLSTLQYAPYKLVNSPDTSSLCLWPPLRFKVLVMANKAKLVLGLH